jgi:eukaryotic-like serine/threonine-protein kinase
VEPLVAGDALGPFVLVRRLGIGGMGEVWVATGPTGDEVAVKVLPAGSLDDPTARARFTREVALAKTVDHPRVQTVLDADAEADQPWLATELVTGPTLAQRVTAEGPLPGPELHALATALAEALVAVHAAGLVHRDVSPANVVLGPDVAVLVDFGIARGPEATSLTETGTVVGTAGWLAPEALRDEELTDAADIWSWALVLTYAGTGRPPAAGTRVEAVMRRVLDGDLDLRGLPPWLDRPVRRSVEATPARRPTAEELLEALGPGHALDMATAPLGATSVAPVEPTAVSRRPRPEPGGERPPTDWIRIAVRAVLIAGAGVLGLVLPLLVVLLAVTVTLVGAVAVRLWSEDRAKEKHPVVSAGTLVLASVVASVAALAETVGLLLALLLVAAFVVGFFVLGGDLG